MTTAAAIRSLIDVFAASYFDPVPHYIREAVVITVLSDGDDDLSRVQKILSQYDVKVVDTTSITTHVASFIVITIEI